MRPRSYYPIFADLNGRRCIVIGGGMVAQRKVTTLLDHGADISVISPEVTKRIAAYAKTGRIRHVTRKFRPGDLRGAWLVYAATDDSALNKRVSETAKRLRIFANIVDQTPLCTFIAPALFKQGSLTVAVSTAGASPSLAKKIRTDIRRLLGREYVPMLRLLTALRGVAKRRLPHYGDRKVYFDELVRGRVFGLVRAGKTSKARKLALSLLQRRAKASVSSKEEGLQRESSRVTRSGGSPRPPGEPAR